MSSVQSSQSSFGAQQGFDERKAVVDGELLADAGQGGDDVGLARVVGRGGGVGVALEVGLPFTQAGAEVGDQVVCSSRPSLLKRSL